MRLLVVLAFIGILFALGSALFELLRKPEDRARKGMVKSLAWRIGLSIALFVFLLVAYTFGWIEPASMQPANGG